MRLIRNSLNKIMPKNLLILIDIQNEYVTTGREFYLNGIEKSLNNCRLILNFARKNNWKIAHIQHLNGIDAANFRPNTKYSDFAPGFEPQPQEMHFVKHDYSCYSSPDFANCLEQFTQSENAIYVIGYNSIMCCLSTLEEARRKKHILNFVTDASYAKALHGFSEFTTHELMLDLYKTKKLGNLITTDDVLKII